MLINSLVPYIFGHKPTYKIHCSGGDIITDLFSLRGKQELGFYFFGNNEKHIISIDVREISMNSNGYFFKYDVQDENIKYGYHHVASCVTQISLDGVVNHTVNDKYNDCFEPGWEYFEKFFRYITNWPIFTHKELVLPDRDQ